jgi:translation initiation factor IF-2
MVKYRVHEVAKDFNLPTKAISKILADYATAPKNHMQVLTDEELNIIFDYLTINNQVESIEEVFALTSKSTGKPADEPAAKEAPEPQEPASAPKREETADIAAAKKQSGDQPRPDVKESKNIRESKESRPHPQDQKTPKAPGETIKAPGKQQQDLRQKSQPHQPHQPHQQAASSKPSVQAPKVPERRVIDTRGATVNIEKYDERLDKFVPEKLANARSGKEKISKKNQDKRGGSSMAAGAKKRQEQREKMQKLQLELAKKQQLKVTIPDEISVGELATRMKKTGAEVVKQLIKLGTMASLSDIIDYDTAALVAMELGCKVEREIVMTIEERLIDDSEDSEEDLKPRSPVVVVMGHVDHGKTSLLDKIRHANVAEGEAGGITQHIGAYQIEVKGRQITFLDTPGHEAFTSMRARGAMVTDIAILVVAADDGIMPQTIEAINHAKAAEVPIIVAINKMDKEGANPQRIKQQLTDYGLLFEEWGGDTIICEISAKTGAGIDTLLEMVLLTAEMRELKANPSRQARGTVIEARLDKGRGPIATVLVQNGTLRQGDIIIAGMTVGRVRTMVNDKGERLQEAGPSVPVEITGLSEAPGAGDTFNAVEDERMARELVEQRKHQSKQMTAGTDRKVTLEDLFSQIQQGEIKEFAVIVKADV